MKYLKSSAVLVSLVLHALLLTSAAYAGIKLEKNVPIGEVFLEPTETDDASVAPNAITFRIYESELASTPIASQTFPEGSWTVDYVYHQAIFPTDSMVRFGVDFTNTEALTIEMDLWVDLLLYGEVKGARERIKQAAWALFAEEAFNAEDVYNKDINPRSITITGYGPVIDSAGQWVGDPTGLQGPKGDTGDKG